MRMKHKITLDTNDIELAIMHWFKEKNKNNVIHSGVWEITKDKQGYDVLYHCELTELDLTNKATRL